MAFPTNPSVGDIHYEDTTDTSYFWTGHSWERVIVGPLNETVYGSTSEASDVGFGGVWIDAYTYDSPGEYEIPLLGTINVITSTSGYTYIDAPEITEADFGYELLCIYTGHGSSGRGYIRLPGGVSANHITPSPGNGALIRLVNRPTRITVVSTTQVLVADPFKITQYTI
jgi:hypothetical protein